MFGSRTMLTLCFLALATASAVAKSPEDDNKRIVMEFHELAFVRHEPREAARKYIGPQYIQHNPRVPNGVAAFTDYFEHFFKENPSASSSLKRILADEDLVAVHSHSRMNEQDPGKAIVDIFRLKAGKIVEHWDVIQDVLTPTANGNTMFDGGAN